MESSFQKEEELFQEKYFNGKREKKDESDKSQKIWLFYIDRASDRNCNCRDSGVPAAAGVESCAEESIYCQLPVKPETALAGENVVYE